MNRLLVGEGVRVRELARERHTLEDVFLGLTSAPAAEAAAPVDAAPVEAAPVADAPAVSPGEPGGRP